MVGLVKAIKSIFTNELEIRVSQDLVTVTWDGQSLSFRPVVHVATGEDPLRIVGVAENFSSHESTTPIPVFGLPPPPFARSDWPMLVNTFMKYVIGHARSHIVVVRPIIRLRGVGALTAMPGVNAALLLQNAIIRAGAVHCTVED